MKSKIADNERSVKRNNDAMDKSRKEVEEQRSAVRELEKKLKGAD
jgi:hypothetical protein